MTYDDQNTAGLPTNNSSKRESASLLPQIYRTDSNRKFLQATLDQLTQPGTVKKINGYIGRQYSKATTTSDIFLAATDEDRQSYQLEPAAVIKDHLGNVTFYKDYLDHVNHIDVFNGNTDNHERLNKQEFYSWNPHIDFDKFVNYQNYYWMPYGPKPVNVYGKQGDSIQTTYPVFLSDEGDNTAFVFDHELQVRNPELILYRGQTYVFEVNTPHYPLFFRSTRTMDETDNYYDGITNNGISKGKITFTVGKYAPDVMYYVSGTDIVTSGVIKIFDVTDGTYLNVQQDILNRKNYRLPSGLELSNGMKLKFHGHVTPVEYANDFWYVEGVGRAIKLINEKSIAMPSTKVPGLFDYDSYDTTAYDVSSTFPHDKDYIVINRASLDRNLWSRSNRWVHQDVITKSAIENGLTPELNQKDRAIRPIIEFEPNLKLFGFGHVAKNDVNLIDYSTKDVFSTIEGSLSYSVDGIRLRNGMRVIFAADKDSMVKNKIFKVNYITINVPGRSLYFESDNVSPAKFLTKVDIDPNTNYITFLSPHGLQEGTQLTYVENGNAAIVGLTNRSMYYAKVISDNVISLYYDSNLTKVVTIEANTNGTHYFEVASGRRSQIHLTVESDADALTNQTVLVKDGNVNGSKLFWYNGTTWVAGPVKSTVNQPPLFDVFNKNAVSYGSAASYKNTTFTGSKVFSYKIGNSIIDSELKFPLSYRSINNIGDISFNFNLLSDTFTYVQGNKIVTSSIEGGFLKQIVSLDAVNYVNGWITSVVNNTQAIIRIYNSSTSTSRFPIDVYDDVHALSDLTVKVYKNGKLVDKSEYTIATELYQKVVVMNYPILVEDIITLKCYAVQNKNENGFYEIPISLQNNPLNSNISELTLGQVIDHVSTIVENVGVFAGTFPGSGNLRDIQSLAAYGTKFVQHSCPMNFSLYHLGSKSANMVEAINQSMNDYGKFKRAFLTLAESSSITAEPKQHVDAILNEMTKNRPISSPYYLSDMFAHGGSNSHEYTVLDPDTAIFPLSAVFSMSTLSNKSVLVYLNDVQLVYGVDYYFTNDFFTIYPGSCVEGDMVVAYEYHSTDGSYCPSTPTKLGLYPKFKPKMYVDDSYVIPTTVIQGHDGSITIAFGDYRDELLLELEKRIYNNIKVTYDPSMFDIADFIPGYNRNVGYTRDEVNNILGPSFYQWTTLVDLDFSKNIGYDETNMFTYNYRNNYSPDGRDIPAYWRGIYQWMFDTDRPHICPWEMLGFSLKPVWWNSVYGPAPYTSDNAILWEDLSKGIIREPGKPIAYNKKFERPVLASYCPVDSSGKLVTPIQSGVAQGIVTSTEFGYFVMGDMGPVESAWRKSSYYPYAMIHAALLMKPNHVIGHAFDRSRIVKNISGQLVYSTTNCRIKLSDIVLPSGVTTSVRSFTSGLVNFVVDYISGDVTARLIDYSSDLQTLTNNIGSKMGGFSSKEKYKLLLDSKSPYSTSGNFVPDENYQIFLNNSSAIKKLVYSGVIITATPLGFEVKGYSLDNPYFYIHPYLESGRVIKIGGISESYVDWQSSTYYAAGKIVSVSGIYYRVKVSHTTTGEFDSSFYSKLVEIPTYGGAEVVTRTSWDFNTEEIVNYGTVLSSIQEVSDFLLGYGAYLRNVGFVFDDFQSSTQSITNWETSVKEFLLWTTQNWPIKTSLSLSPSANKLSLTTKYSVVNDVTDSFYKYQIFDVNKSPIDPHQIKTFRHGNDFTLATRTKDTGVYGAVFYLVQKEHVLIMDNKTIFSDVIYDMPAGYKQDRVKVLGYISRNWDGGFDIPGFIFDQANIKEWQQWTDYHLGDTIKYKEFYYSANKFVPGTESFNSSDWIIQRDKPVARMLPNWDYKAEQFSDFYELDTDNFDSQQQKMAQHLIGYQKRQYLENIIKDDVSQYKFYQGMILEKGTSNAFSKLFDVLSSSNKESLIFNEEWAIRCGEYGAVNNVDTYEFILDETKFKQNPQPIELVSTINTTLNDLVYRFDKNGLYVKPRDYIRSNDTINPPWAQNLTQMYTRTPGHVRYEDVKFSFDTFVELMSYDITDVNDGDMIWCAFEGREWNVYEYMPSQTPITLINVENSFATFQIGLTPVLSLSDGDVIGITSDELNSLFVISGVVDNTFQIFHRDFGHLNDLTNLVVHVLYSRRYKNKPSQSILNGLTMAWIDNDDGKWTVYSNGTLLRSQEYSADVSRIKRAFLYNKTNSNIVQYLDVIDPVHGKIPGIADQEIRYKTYYDPAVYSIGNDNVVVEPDSNWSSEKVGQLWWDLTRAKFIVNDDSDIEYRSNSFNQLYKTASIDIYEWVESEYKPSVWDELADTDSGIALGISGKSRYGDNVYATVARYDNITDTVYYTYYFWVKNKTIVPTNPTVDRNMSAISVAEIIANPHYAGYPCMSLLSSNSMVLINVEQYIHDTDIILSIEYWNSDNTQTNYHTEWKLISENPGTKIPANIEQKWFDSLVGYDFMDRQLPDYSLPAKLRYGIEHKPRQSMFVNRLEALKQYIEGTNTILASKLIIDDYDLTPLYGYDTPPSVVSGKWDATVDTEEELKYLGTALLQRAELLPVIVDGKITSVEIINSGYGYINPPSVDITGGDGKAKLSVSLTTKGEIDMVTVLETGDNYGDNTSLVVRPFAVLVSADSGNSDKWAIRYWETSEIGNRVFDWRLFYWNNTSKLSNMQLYDVTKYWDYIDWYADGYNQFTKIDRIVDSTYLLYTSDVAIGEIVKVNHIGTGGWLLLKKVSNVSVVDYTLDYTVIGRQNGTIQFSDILYNYDTKLYPVIGNNPDPYASVLRYELRIVLNTIKNNILIDEYHVEYLKLFFSSIRYILSEQVYADWVFKTSFVKITHNVGDLVQKPTYNGDNLESFEDYVNEIKPYRTKVREFISVYDGHDESNTAVMDFDLPTFVDEHLQYQQVIGTVKHGIIDSNSANTDYPWKAWSDNVGFKVTAINVIDGGEGYTVPPMVRIISNSGTGAVAKAFISHGKVNRVKLISAGSGYLSAPTIVFDGGVPKTGRVARACSNIGDSVVRGTTIAMKFDRISKEYFIKELANTESFTGNGIRLQFRLLYAPNLENNTSAVFVNGEQLLRNEYKFSVAKEVKNGYTRYYGVLSLTSAPDKDSDIQVSYLKNIEYLSANDRINFYYQPGMGEPGKDLSQLMSGIDYAGIIVTGSGFEFPQGWDTIPWDSDVWDSFDPGFDNYNMVVAKDTQKIALPYIPEVNEYVNVYIDNIRIDDIVLTYPLITDTYTVAHNDKIRVDGVNGYFIITLPIDPTDGEIITIADGGEWGLYPVFIDGNGKTINGITANYKVSFYENLLRLKYSSVTNNWTTALSMFNENAVMPPIIGDGVHDEVDIPLKAYDIATKHNSKLVVDTYVDSNITIITGIVTVPQTIKTPFDSMAFFEFRSVRYQIHLSVNGTEYSGDIRLINYNNDIKGTLYIEGATATEQDLFDTPIVGIGTFTHSVDGIKHVLEFTPDTDDVVLSFVKWQFSDGGAHEADTVQINDTTFNLLSDTAYVYESNEALVIDEFEKAEFYSACYYMQLHHQDTVHICELELVHNEVDISLTVTSVLTSGVNEILGTFTAEIVDDSVVIYLTTNIQDVQVVYSRVALSSLTYRVVDDADVRRIADSIYAMVPFSYQAATLVPVVVDSVDITRCLHIRYQIELIAPARTQIIDLTMINGTLSTSTYTNNVGGECGYFTGRVVEGIFELVFTPSVANTFVNGVKFMIIDSTVDDIFADANYRNSIVSKKLMTSTLGYYTVIDKFNIDYRSARYEIYLDTLSAYAKATLIINNGAITHQDITGPDAATFFVDDNVHPLFTVSVSNSIVTVGMRVFLPNVNMVAYRTLLNPLSLPYNIELPSEYSTKNIRYHSGSVLAQTSSTIIDIFDKDAFSHARYFISLNSDVGYQTIDLLFETNSSNVNVIHMHDGGVSLGTVTAQIIQGYVNVTFNKTTGSNVLIKSSIQYVSTTNSLPITTDNALRTINNMNYIETDSYLDTRYDFSTAIESFNFSARKVGTYYFYIKAETVALPALPVVDLIEYHYRYDNSVVYPTTITGTIGTIRSTIVDGKYINIFFDVNPLYHFPEVTIINVMTSDKLYSSDYNLINQSLLGLDSNSVLTFIKQVSDGSLPEQPYDSVNKVSLTDFDSRLTGGFFENSDVIGFRPEDFLIDGDDMVTPMTSYAPEEMLPGYVTDAVSIKVYDLPTGGSPMVIMRTYRPNGVTTTFNYGQNIPSEDHVFVRQGYHVIPSSEYTFEWTTNSIVFNTAPLASDDKITIVSFGFNSNFLLDTGSVISDGTLVEIITRAPWLVGKVKSTVMVNGQPYDFETFRTTEAYECPELLGIRFGSAIPAGYKVQFMIESNESATNPTHTTNVMEIDVIDGSVLDTMKITGEYQLGAGIISPNTIVTTIDSMNNERLLTPGRVFYFTMKSSNKQFVIPSYAAAEYSLMSADVDVYVNGTKKVYLRDYTFDSSTNTVTLNKYVAKAVVIIALDKVLDYMVDNSGKLIIRDLALISDSKEIKIIKFYDYGSVDVERSVDVIKSESVLQPNTPEYSIFYGKSGGSFLLRAPLVETSYLWVIKNRVVLQEQKDYFVMNDKVTVRLKDVLIDTDVIQIIAFSDNVIRGSLGYMQFKDMLNRVHYKRLNKNKVTQLTKDLFQEDQIIYVKNGLLMDIPNPGKNLPGIIEINGERIEYFSKYNNELSDLRRGTLGTGVPKMHRMGTNILNLGPSETIPYTDTNSTFSFITRRRTTVVPVANRVIRRCDMTDRNGNLVNIIGEVRCGDSPGSYTDLSALTDVGPYRYYRVVEAGTANGQITTPAEIGDVITKVNGEWRVLTYDVTDDIEVYVGGTRLKKDEYMQYSDSTYPYSPEGDTLFKPDYTVNQAGYFIKLLTPVKKGIKISVVRKSGMEWVGAGEKLSTAKNIVASFIREVEAIWPQYLVDKYQYVLASDNDFVLSDESDNVIELD